MRSYKPPAHTVELDHPTAAAWSFQGAAAPCLICLLHHIIWAQDQHPFGQLSVSHQHPRSTAVLLATLLVSGEHEHSVCVVMRG